MCTSRGIHIAGESTVSRSKGRDWWYRFREDIWAYSWSLRYWCFYKRESVKVATNILKIDMQQHCRKSINNGLEYWGKDKIIWQLGDLSYQKYNRRQVDFMTNLVCSFITYRSLIFRIEPAIKPTGLLYCFSSRQRPFITEILKSEPVSQFCCCACPFLSKEWSSIFMVGRWSFFSGFHLHLVRNKINGESHFFRIYPAWSLPLWTIDS